MKEIEEIEKVIDGVRAKIQIQKSKNQALRNSLNEVEMNKSKAMKEIQRLKEVNINLENNIKETKQQIQEQDNKEVFDSFMQDLGKELFKWRKQNWYLY